MTHTAASTRTDERRPNMTAVSGLLGYMARRHLPAFDGSDRARRGRA